MEETRATAIYNFLRNIGGSVGVAVVTTIVSQRAQFHQSRLVEYLTPFRNAYWIARLEISELLALKGIGAQATDGIVYGELQRQSRMMAFNDAFFLLSVTMLVVLVLVFSMRIKTATTGEVVASTH